jgi:hypothetical protein
MFQNFRLPFRFAIDEEDMVIRIHIFPESARYYYQQQLGYMAISLGEIAKGTLIRNQATVYYFLNNKLIFANAMPFTAMQLCF